MWSHALIRRVRSTCLYSEPYYETTLHELGHWSGHEPRLDRDITGRMRAYAAEKGRPIPKRVQLGQCRVAWRYEEICEWIAERVARSWPTTTPE